MFSNYGLMRVSFGGAGNDRGLVLVNGVPAQDGFGGQVDWAAYPVQDLQRAELLLGAGSALYGAGAVGGVLDLQTVAPPAVRGDLPSGDFEVAAGTNAYTRQSSNVRAWVAPRLSTAVSLQQQRLQYWDLPPAYESRIDRIAQSNAAMASVRLRYQLGNGDALDLGERGAWDDQFEGRQNYTFSRRQQQSDVRYTHATAQSSLSTALFSRTAYIVNVADQFPNNPGVLRYMQNVPTNEDGISSSWIAAGGPSTFELRADARHVRGQSEQFGAHGTFQNSGSGSQTLYGIAAQETWRAKRFEVVAGARNDTVRSYDKQLSSFTNGALKFNRPPGTTDRAISPRVAVRYDVAPRWALRASSGAGFRAPFLNELVRGFFIGNVSYQPNPSLVPERSLTNSAGIDYAGTRARLSLDFFDTSVRDAIMFRTIDATHQIRSNVARTQTDGFTATYTRGVGPCSRVSASFTDQNARVTSGPNAVVGKRLQYVPAQSAYASYDAQIGRVDAGISLSYLGPTYADDLNVQPLGTALVAGARVRIPFASGAAFEISAENLTGARYLSSIDRYGLPAIVSFGFSLPVGRAQDRSCAE
jgi:outer membrane cobalamin receptor